MRSHFILFCVLLTVISGCNNSPPPQQPQARLVRVFTVVDKAIEAARTYSGDVHARHEALLAFRLSGKIAQRLVDAGSIVRAGQVLARLDPADAVLQLAETQARYAQAEAELKRYRELKNRNFISQSALDAKETAYQASLAQAGLARNQSAYTTLTAERTGSIAAVLAEAGQVVAAGQPIFRLAPDGEREVALAVPEVDVAEFKIGDEAEVTLWAKEGVRLHGRLRELAAAADTATRTYAARVTLVDADPRLPVGLTATVRFLRKTAQPELLIPATALFQKGKGFAVWKLGTRDELSLQAVSVLRYTDDGALIGTGLMAGDRIVAAGVHTLMEGEKVKTSAAPDAEGGAHP